jgi:hypothetical protein
MTTDISQVGISDSRSGTEALVRDCARQLGNWDEETFEGVWRRIGELGPHRALPMLVRLLGDPDPGVRAGAAEIVGEIGGRDELAALLPLLDDELPSVRQSAALAYARLAADPPTTLQALELIDRNGRAASAVPHKVVEARHYNVGFYLFPMPERSPRAQELGSRLLYAARVVDSSANSFVGLIEVRRDVSRNLQRTRLDLFDGRATTRLDDFSTTPSPNEIGALIGELLAKRCASCQRFAKASAELCPGCGSPLAPNDEQAEESVTTTLDLPVSAVPGPVDLAGQLARGPETSPGALGALLAELERGAEHDVLDPLWTAFHGTAADRPAERERLAEVLADAVTARGADSFEETLARLRQARGAESGIVFRALARLFPLSAWRPGDPLLAGAKLAPAGDGFAVATRWSVAVYDGRTLAESAARAFFRSPPGREPDPAPSWRERPHGFADGWVACVAYGPRKGVVAETVRFVPGSIERLEPSLAATLHVGPFAERGVTIQSARSVRDAVGCPWAVRPDERGLALVDGGVVRVHDLTTGSVVAFLAPHAGPIGFIGFSPDGTRLVTSDGDEARLWNAERGVMLRAIPLKGREALGFDRLGRLLAHRREERRALVVDLITGAHAGEAAGDDLLYLATDGVLRCAPASLHRDRAPGRRLCGLGPGGRALFAGEDDVLYWDGAQERALRPGRYQ